MRCIFQRSRVAGPAANRRAATFFCALAGALMVAAATQAADHGLTVRDAWMRAIMPSRPAAGYFTLSNETEKPVMLVGAASPDCGTLMLHQSLHEDGRDSMAMVKSIPVPANGKLAFAPGGYHLMCMSPSQAVTAGHSVPVTLRFADGGSLTARFAVRGATGK